MATPKRVLGTFTLAMITVAAIVSLRNLPLSAEFGLASIFYFVISALIFFIPAGLVTAELATGWPRAGGQYIWVSEAFGKPIGFFALWMAWMENIAWFPVILAFTAAMLAHLLSPVFPGLEENKIFYLIVMLSIFWGVTFLNFFGIELSGWITSIGTVCGTIIPGILIIALGLWWFLSDQATHIVLSWDQLVPEFRLDTMVFFSGILLGFSGVEIAAFHIREAKNPQKDYPLALAVASAIILVISILGTLSVAFVVPQEDISLLSGLIQAFTVFFSAFHLLWLVPIMALFALIGAMAGINAWIAGPAKGLLITAEDGFLPKSLETVNARGVPIGMLIFQAIVGTLLSFAFLWMDSHNAAFWILTGLSAQFTVVKYAMLFAAAVKLRYSQSNVLRPYRVPGGKFGIWLIAIMGIAVCLFGFFIVFIPPVQLNTGDRVTFQSLLVVSLLILSLIPIYFSYKRKKVSDSV